MKALNSLFTVISIYIIALFVYSCILQGFLITVTKTIDKLSRCFEIFIILFFLTALSIVVFSKCIKTTFFITIAMFSLVFALLAYAHSVRKYDSRNIEYYSNKADELESLHKAGIIDDETYQKKLETLKTKFKKIKYWGNSNEE